MTTLNSNSALHFENFYRRAVDPWSFASSDYERRRYESILAALTKTTYKRVFEPGCSEGELTAMLAQRAEELIACDISVTAAGRARERCRNLSNVHISVRDIADGAPEGTFDLIIFSELGYYFSEERLTAVIQQLTSQLETGGEFVAVHWLGHSADHVLHGDQVHGVLEQALPWERVDHSRYAGFRLDSWRRKS